MFKFSIFGINSAIRGKSHLVIGVNLSVLASHKSINIISALLKLVAHVLVVVSFDVLNKRGFWLLNKVLRWKKVVLCCGAWVWGCS